MILYKYIDENSLDYIFLDNAISLKFNPIGKFNDPFESFGYSLATVNDDNSLFHLTFRHDINSYLACLCLSKTPLDVLMWSHYANSHNGYVVGIDTEIAGFENCSECVITARDGEIKYRKVRNTEKIFVDANSINDNAILKKLLLEKSIHWAYEKEVRIIKKTNKLTINKDSLLHMTNNIGAIREIYVGINNKSFPAQARKNQLLNKLILDNKINLFKCEFKMGTWDLKKEEYSLPVDNDFRISHFDEIEKVIRAIHRDKI